MYFGFAFGVFIQLPVSEQTYCKVVDEMKNSFLKFWIAFYLPELKHATAF